MNSLVFLSQGIQFAIFLLFVALVLVFIKGASLEHRMKQIENGMNNYVTVEDYLETVNNLVAESMGKL